MPSKASSPSSPAGKSDAASSNLIGTGYVGLVSGACFSEFGVSVTCVDKDVDKIERILRNVLPQSRFDVASNPEFLREGSAIQDFMRPDRVVIGTDSEHARTVMRALYRPLYLLETPIVFTTLETAELIKYAANAFLATKITFINEMADLCEAVGADVQHVARGIGLAHLIIELTGSRSTIEYRPLPVDDPVQRCPDISQAKAMLSWEPRMALRPGLQRTIDYFDKLLSERGQLPAEPPSIMV